MKESLFLLRNPNALRKLCRKLDKDTGCKRTEKCDRCPIIIFQRVEWLVNNKGMTLGEAYNVSIRHNE